MRAKSAVQPLNQIFNNYSIKEYYSLEELLDAIKHISRLFDSRLSFKTFDRQAKDFFVTPR